MNRLIVLLALSLTMLACGGKQSGSVTGTSPTTPTNYGEFSIAKIPGTDLERAQKLDVNGFVVEEGLLKDGKRNGVWVKYHQNSVNPSVMTSYVDDKYNGTYLEFDRTQQVTLRASYIDNLLDGYWAKYVFGSITFEASYKNGKLDGVYKEYRTGAQVAKEIHYKNGLLDGPYRFYDDVGKVVLEYVYRKGEKI